jgi:hypothetical protein
MAYYAITKQDGYGKRILGNVSSENISWITGAYTFIPNLTSVGGNTFSILYQSGELLYDQYTPVIGGGDTASNVPSTETYACPSKASGAITWADINPAGAGIGASYIIDGLDPAHLGRARSETFNPYVYETADGYSHEMFLLFAYTQDAGAGIPAHYFFWVYMDNATGLWTRVPNTDDGLPTVGETFDIWLPTSVNVSKAKWSSWLVQDSDKLGGTGSGNVGQQIKIEETIASANEADGTSAFGSANISGLPNLAVSETILGFVNGVEVNVEVGNPAVLGTDVDIVFDNTTPTYPGTTDIYWKGSNYGASASNLGDLEVGDIVRIYYLSS